VYGFAGHGHKLRERTFELHRRALRLLELVAKNKSMILESLLAVVIIDRQLFGGLVGNLLASAIVEGLAGSKRKISDLVAVDEIAKIRNHEMQRALVVAQCRAGDILAVVCLMEDFEAKESGKAHILRERVSKLITRGSDPSVKRLWEVRKSLADTITATENQKLEDIDAALSLSPDAPTLAEGSAAAYAHWKDKCTEAFISSVASEGSLPDEYKVRLRESWFDLFRLAFREELGANDRAGMEYLVDSFERIGKELQESGEKVEKLFQQASADFEAVDRKLNGLRSVLNDVRELLKKRSDTNGLSESEFEAGINRLQDDYIQGLEGLRGYISKEAAHTRTVIREGQRDGKRRNHETDQGTGSRRAPRRPSLLTATDTVLRR